MRTRVWDEDEPDGDLEADHIDNSARAFKVDLREIVNQIMGVPEATALLDPVIDPTLTLAALATGLGLAIPLVKTIPWFAGQRDQSVETGTITGDRNKFVVTGATAFAKLAIPVVLPVGVIITKLRVLAARNNGGHTLSMNFYEMQDGADVAATSISQGSTSVSPVWKQSATVAIPVVVDRYYGFEVTADNGNVGTATELGFYAFQVQYTSASAAQR